MHHQPPVNDRIELHEISFGSRTRRRKVQFRCIGGWPLGREPIPAITPHRLGPSNEYAANPIHDQQQHGNGRSRRLVEVRIRVRRVARRAHSEHCPSRRGGVVTLGHVRLCRLTELSVTPSYLPKRMSNHHPLHRFATICECNFVPSLIP